MKDKIEFTVSMKVTIPQMLALKAMFEYWNILANIGASRFVGFYVDGDGDFHPNCLFFQSKETQELNDELIKKGNSSARWEQAELLGKKKHFGQFFKDQQQELTEAYRRTTEQLNEERSKLQKERSEL